MADFGHISPRTAGRQLGRTLLARRSGASLVRSLKRLRTLGEDWLHVNDRGPVQGLEIADEEAAAPDLQDSDAVQSDWVRPVL